MIRDLLRSMRPRRWAKNIVMAAGLVFGQNLADPESLLRAAAAMAIFCLLSGCSYIINDVIDIDRDRAHPVKSRRPIASGRFSTRLALTVALVLAFICLLLSWKLGLKFFVAASAFFSLEVAYSIVLGRVVVLDLFALAGAFILRVVAGAWAVRVVVSPWLLVCTMLLSLLLALGVRRHELVAAAGDITGCNPVLGKYNPYLMDQMIAVVTSATLVAYVLYTLSEETVSKFGTRWLVLTSPFVLYGIFRYLYLLHRREGELSPEKLLLTDRPFQLTLAAYAATVAAILYF